MKPSDFFEEEPAPDDTGYDPLLPQSRTLNPGLISRLRSSTQDGIEDLDAAYGLVQLAHRELEAFGTNHGQELDDEGINAVLRTLKSVLRRLSIEFDPPFRDFRQFHGYWSANRMSGSWAARRGYLAELFNPILSQLDSLEEASRLPSIRGVDGEMKNIIFASTGPKPEIVLRDAINNVIEITRYAEQCLVYNRSLTVDGLTWGELLAWWRAENGLDGETDLQVAQRLYLRLHASLDNDAERLLFRTYCERYRGEDGVHRPVLLPQVYLHYDPLTRRERQLLGKPERLTRERMDFLMLLRRNVRIVVEVDGKQHYSEGNVASPQQYGRMVAEDRALRLKGYDVYRFGGDELSGREDAIPMLRRFFDELDVHYARGS